MLCQAKFAEYPHLRQSFGIVLLAGSPWVHKQASVRYGLSTQVKTLTLLRVHLTSTYQYYLHYRLAKVHRSEADAMSPTCLQQHP